MAIRIFVTGGTIDSVDYKSEEEAPKDASSAIPKLLRDARVSVECNVDVVFFKDSRFVNNSDRGILLQKCRECKEERIVVTHGSITMADTAAHLGNAKLEKTVVLMGAITPAKKENSDAQFNIGFAIAAVQFLPKGVYIAMNGRVFAWNNVRKNIKTGYFEETK
ncbi:asparaginase [Candidatus Micrarchaeota archaeon]|nr:asparaginase [Candidatus Micrarchaeota archaeon]